MYCTKVVTIVVLACEMKLMKGKELVLLCILQSVCCRNRLRFYRKKTHFETDVDDLPGLTLLVSNFEMRRKCYCHYLIMCSGGKFSENDPHRWSFGNTA